jgi:hypothetical protein
MINCCDITLSDEPSQAALGMLHHPRPQRQAVQRFAALRAYSLGATAST